MPVGASVPLTVAELVRHGERRLRPSETSRLDSELLLAHALGCDRAAIYRDSELVIDLDQRAAFEERLRARAVGRPLAQLIGAAEFWSLSLIVDEHVLIPRPETELLVETALNILPRSGEITIADLGTGSGAIAIAIAVERPDVTIVATDRSAPALRVAHRNRELHGAAGVHLLQANWMRGLDDMRFDLVVSNPPYVAAGDPLVAGSDIRFEPELALTAGHDGLSALRAITGQVSTRLKPGGSVVVEHGYNQGAAVRALFEGRGFDGITTARDLADLERITYARNDS